MSDCEFRKHRNELIRFGKNFAGAVASTALTISSVDAVKVQLRSEYVSNIWTNKTGEFGALAEAASTNAATPQVVEFTLNPSTSATTQLASAEYRARIDATFSNGHKYTEFVNFHVTDDANAST